MFKQYDALSVENISKAGRTRPLIITCESGGITDYHRKTLLVKYLGGSEVTPMGLFREFIGNQVARAFGVQTPEPALVTFGDDFVKAANPVLQKYGLQIKPGYAVGCEYLGKDIKPLIYPTSLAPNQLPEACLLYGYDLLVQNPDRRIGNPNCGYYKGSLIAYDFDLAFSFIEPYIIVKPEPWELSKLAFAREHVFHRSLKQLPPNWKPVTEGLLAVDISVVEALCSSLPTEWQQWTPNVCEHLSILQDNVSALEFELQRSLS